MEAEKPLISVIVPVYKVEQYLNRCVESIANQTYENLEIILIDDGSPDTCPQLCDDWAKKDARIRAIHKENGGASSARNEGLKVAQGAYIGFVDADDYILHNFYQHLYDILTAYKADLACCDYVRKDADFNKQPSRLEIDTLQGEKLWNLFYRQEGQPSCYSIWNRLYKRELLKGLFFEEGKTTEDVPFLYEVYKRDPVIVFSNFKMYLYFENEGGVTRSPLCEKDLALLEVWEKIASAESGTPNEKAALQNYYRAYFTLYLKGKKYGCESSEMQEKMAEWKDTIQRHKKELRNGKFLDWKRKLLLRLM